MPSGGREVLNPQQVASHAQQWAVEVGEDLELGVVEGAERGVALPRGGQCRQGADGHVSERVGLRWLTEADHRLREVLDGVVVPAEEEAQRRHVAVATKRLRVDMAPSFVEALSRMLE